MAHKREGVDVFDIAGVRPYRFWKATGWLASKLYVLGITSSGGATTMTSEGTWYTMPRFNLNRRPYVLGWRTDKWRCLLRYRHWPAEFEVAFGMCGKCLPWPCCGSITRDHATGCADG